MRGLVWTASAGASVVGRAVGNAPVAKAPAAKPCARWEVSARPPAWFWVWVRWRLGRTEFKGHASQPAYRPGAVPLTVPPTVWKQYDRFLAGKTVVIRVCAR